MEEDIPLSRNGSTGEGEALIYFISSNLCLILFIWSTEQQQQKKVIKLINILKLCNKSEYCFEQNQVITTHVIPFGIQH